MFENGEAPEVSIDTERAPAPSEALLDAHQDGPPDLARQRGHQASRIGGLARPPGPGRFAAEGLPPGRAPVAVATVSRDADPLRPRRRPVALITIDRPGAKRARHVPLRDLAAAWRRFRTRTAWVPIVTGVGGAFMAGADLKTYIPQITRLHSKDLLREVTEIDGCRLSDGTRAVLRNAKIYKPIIAVGGPCVAGGHGDARRRRPRIAAERHLRGDGAQSGACSPAGDHGAAARQLAFRAPWSSSSPPGLPRPTGARGRAHQRDRPARRVARQGLGTSTASPPTPMARVQATKESVRGLALDPREAATKVEEELERRGVLSSEDAKEGRPSPRKRPPRWTGR